MLKRFLRIIHSVERGITGLNTSNGATLTIERTTEGQLDTTTNLP